MRYARCPHGVNIEIPTYCADCVREDDARKQPRCDHTYEQWGCTLPRGHSDGHRNCEGELIGPWVRVSEREYRELLALQRSDWEITQDIGDLRHAARRALRFINAAFVDCYIDGENAYEGARRVHAGWIEDVVAHLERVTGE